MIGRLVALLFVEALSYAALAGHPATWGVFGPVHAACAIAALAQLRRRGPTASQPGVALLWVGAVLGPAGILAGLALQPLWWRSRHMLPIAGTAPPEPERDGARVSITRILDERVHYPDADRLGPLATVFRQGTIADRRAAIEAVVSGFEPRLSPIVALALTDGDQTIRALGASASAQIVQRLTLRRARLEAAVAALGTAETYLALADLLAAHGRHDVLVSDTQRDRMREQAAVALRTAVTMLPADDARRGRIAATLYALDGGTPTDDPLPLPQACDALLRARDFAGLSRRCAMPDAAALPPSDPLHDVVAFWRDACPA